MDFETAFSVGGWSLLAVILLGVATGVYMAMRGRKQRHDQETLETRADAKRWYEMLGRQLNSLSPGDDAVATQALKDAAERHNRAAALFSKAETGEHYKTVRQAATEGLHYTSAARARLGMVAGPQGPPPVAPDGRPMYEELYRAAPTMDERRRGDNRVGTSAGVRGVARVARHQ